MKAFIAFVVILFLAIGGAGGFWAWGKWNRVEDWGLGLELGSEWEDDERESVEERYNQILDQDEVLENAVKVHNLTSYYGVSSSEEALVKLKEDTFIRIPNNNSMRILFRGKRSQRKERTAAIRTVSEDFFKHPDLMNKL